MNMSDYIKAYFEAVLITVVSLLTATVIVGLFGLAVAWLLVPVL